MFFYILLFFNQSFQKKSLLQSVWSKISSESASQVLSEALIFEKFKM